MYLNREAAEMSATRETLEETIEGLEMTEGAIMVDKIVEEVMAVMEIGMDNREG